MFAESFWVWSNTGLGYIVNVFFFVGGIVSTIAFVDRRHRKNEEKRDSERDAEIETAVEAKVTESITKLMEGVDSAIEKSVREEIGELKTAVAEVQSEVRYNGGSTMKDSQRRLEASQSTILLALDALQEGQTLQRDILNNQVILMGVQKNMIEKIDSRQDSDAKVAIKFGEQMANHLGWHAAKRGDS